MKGSAVVTILRNGADVRAVNVDYEIPLHIVVSQPEVLLKDRLALLDALLTNYTDEGFEEKTSQHYLFEHPEQNGVRGKPARPKGKHCSAYRSSQKQKRFRQFAAPSRRKSGSQEQ